MFSQTENMPLLVMKDGVQNMETVLVSKSEPVMELCKVAATQGDDLSPPNSTKVERMNGINLIFASSAGWSSTAPKDDFSPSKIELHTALLNSTKEGDFNLSLTVKLEYTNPFQSESMMIKAKVAKVTLCDNQPLELIDTSYEDFVNGHWVNISSNVTYSETAEAVVDAVLADSNAGQTAGRTSTKGEAVAVKLGPVGEKGRITLKFQANQVYSYDTMATAKDCSDLGETKLIPLLFVLPHADLDDPKGDCSIAISFRAPNGADLLPLSNSRDAYADFISQEEMKSYCVITAQSLTQKQPNGVVGFSREWRTLPPNPTCLLCWVRMLNPKLPLEDWIDVGSVQGEQQSSSGAMLLAPNPGDVKCLCVPMPGFGPPVHLSRLLLTVPAAPKLPGTCTRIVLNLTLSDASGSTGCSTQSGKSSVRQEFNRLAIQRFLRRLESVPALVTAGLLTPFDIITDCFWAFDTKVVDEFHATFHVSELMTTEVVEEIKYLIQAGCVGPNKVGKIGNFVQKISRLSSHGGTSFSQVAASVIHAKKAILSSALARISQMGRSTNDSLMTVFVDFDTDGGDNYTNPYPRFKELVDTYNVGNGVVTGFGNWVDQDCASRVAKILGDVPALLGQYMPEQGHEGENIVFRRSFSTWLSTLRNIPVKFTIDAGAIATQHPTQGLVSVNGLDVIAAQSLDEVWGSNKLKFEVPDVSEVEFTKTVINGSVSGQKLVLYVASPMEAMTLARSIRISCGADLGTVSTSVGAEKLDGRMLGVEWLKVLTGSRGLKINQNFAVPRLIARFEDEVSFRFNLASPSGTTAYLGRAKTQPGRPAILQSQHPTDPSLPLPKDTTQSRNIGARGGGRGRGRGGGAFGFGSYGCQARGSIQPQGQSYGYSSSKHSFGSSPSTLLPRRSPAPHFGGSSESLIGSSFSSVPSRSCEMPSVEQPFVRWQHYLSQTRNLGSLEGKDDLKKVLDGLLVQIRKVKGLEISYYCDVCSRIIHGARYHCFDCRDYDECPSCYGTHTELKPNHNLVSIGEYNQQYHSNFEDPLVNQLLGSQRTSSAKNLSRIDWSIALSEKTVQHFLALFVEWWSVLRRRFGHLSLPDYLSDQEFSEISGALNLPVRNPQRMNIMETLAKRLYDKF